MTVIFVALNLSAEISDNISAFSLIDKFSRIWQTLNAVEIFIANRLYVCLVKTIIRNLRHIKQMIKFCIFYA